MILLTLAVIEGLSFGGVMWLTKKGVFYKPERPHDRQEFSKAYQKYLAIRDENLGWPSPSSFGKDEYDKSGSRMIPSFPDETNPCVSLYGDSFTFGAEVTAEKTWSNVLSQLLGCRVSNFGVGGYGTDQAYLRFQLNAADSSSTVILGYLVENIARNVNQYRLLFYFLPEQYMYGLKPRFILDEKGELKLIKLPKFSEQEFLEMTENPGQSLPYEYFVPGGKFVNWAPRFPYTAAILGFMNHNRFRARLSGKPRYAEFYNPDHSSQALQVTVKILEAFQTEAKKRGKKSLVLIIPSGLEFRYYRKKGVWLYQTLVNELAKREVEFLDAGPMILDRLQGRDACDLFTNHCKGHFNEEGNRLLASILHSYLTPLDFQTTVIARRPTPALQKTYGAVLTADLFK